MNNATFQACKELYGDIPRFLGTSFVAQDLERIRMALDEPELTAYLISYGTAVGQTYANMFPSRVGRIVMEGTSYVRGDRELGGFSSAAIDNTTDVWDHGFLGECISAGPKHCALAVPPGSSLGNVTLAALKTRMSSLFASIAKRPIPAVTRSNGPTLITYSSLIRASFSVMYNPFKWPEFAEALQQLEQRNATPLARLIDSQRWEYDLNDPSEYGAGKSPTDELASMVVCADAFDAPQPPFDDEDDDGLRWWSEFWRNMTSQSWLGGDPLFFYSFPCRHYVPTFGNAIGEYRRDLNATLSNPVIIISGTYDPVTPLRCGKRLLAEMGRNARMVVHHGYGHPARDFSSCTEAATRDYILHGILPGEQETHCFADGKPYRYDGAAFRGW